MGVIAAADQILSLAGNGTKIVAGHARSATKRTHEISGHAGYYA
jgi:hypothetical protein